MEISIADQIALDDALVAPADRLKIGKCNLRLSSDVTSKEATLQVVYDVLKLTPFYKAFQVTADAPEIYMQEFWASAYVHNRSVRFKMNNKKHIIGLDQFRDILQICPKVGNKKFVEPPLEKEILIFLASLGHSGDIRKITDVNVNKLHQPWRSFAAIINKCLSGIPSYDSLRLSQAQILWGMYNKKNVDYAYLLWEDFIFKIENKNTKKGNAMYYPRFTKLVVKICMEKDPFQFLETTVALTNEESAIESYKSIMLLLQEQFLNDKRKQRRKAKYRYKSLNRSSLLKQKRSLEKENEDTYWETIRGICEGLSNFNIITKRKVKKLQLMQCFCQSARLEETMQIQMSVEGLTHRVETGVQDEKQKKRSNIFDWFQQLQTTSPDQAGIIKFDIFASGNLHIGAKSETVYAFAPQGTLARALIQKRIIVVTQGAR
ncbi:hypothetical protein Tco_0308930 [Tanacetum coccineum]